VEVRDASKQSGCIGTAKLGFYIPLFAPKLGGHFTIDQLDEMLRKTISYHDALIMNHGIEDGTKRWKALWLYALQLCEGRNPNKLSWVATGRVDHWPTKLGHLRPIYHLIKDGKIGNLVVDGSHVLEARRLLLTFSKLNKICEQYCKVDVENLQRTFKLETTLVNKFNNFIRLKLSEFRENLNLNKLKITPFFGPANGPNSAPKLETANAEALKIISTPKFLKSFERIAFTTNNLDFIEFMKQSASNFEKSQPEDQKIDLSKIKLRKITAVPDSGNKSRTIAICDWWTQTLFTTSEKTILDVTMKLYSKNCCYFSHNSGFKEILNLPSETLDQLVSLDAENWTDNLPNHLQKAVVRTIFGSDIAQDWAILAVECSWDVKGLNHTIKYGKGQGMGTKGSFAIAQLTNLLFIDFLYSELYPDLSDPFFIEVGDDMVVQDPLNLFKKEFERIGVPININKTKHLTSKGSFVEFVSRNIWKGNDYSMISPRLVSRFTRNDYYVLTLMNHLRERGWETSVEDLFNNKYSTEERAKDKVLNRLNKFYKILSMLQFSGITGSIEPVKDPLIYLKSLDSSEIVQLIAALIIVPAIRVRDFEVKTQNLNREDRLARAKAQLLFDHWVTRKTDETLWQLAIRYSWNLDQIRLVWSLIPIMDRQNENQAYGYHQYKLGISVPAVTSVGSEASDPLICNPWFIQHLLVLNIQVNKVVGDHKVAHKLSIFDQSNTTLLLEFLSTLNKALSVIIRYVNNDITITFPKQGRTPERTIGMGEISHILGLWGLKGSMLTLSALLRSQVPLSFGKPFIGPINSPSNDEFDGGSST
jgi:hypothetical protein